MITAMPSVKTKWYWV